MDEGLLGGWLRRRIPVHGPLPVPQIKKTPGQRHREPGWAMHRPRNTGSAQEIVRNLGQDVAGEAAGPLAAPTASRRSVVAESAAGQHPLSQTLRLEPGDSDGCPAALEQALLWQ